MKDPKVVGDAAMAVVAGGVTTLTFLELIQALAAITASLCAVAWYVWRWHVQRKKDMEE
jgi:Na+(H+)/acetate symporter ActP